MAQRTFTFDDDGPKTRLELNDAIKAYFVLTGTGARKITVTQEMYDDWMGWRRPDAAETAADKTAIKAGTEKICGLTIIIGDRFALS